MLDFRAAYALNQTGCDSYGGAEVPGGLKSKVGAPTVHCTRHPAPVPTDFAATGAMEQGILPGLRRQVEKLRGKPNSSPW
jgi:hypothetical protein